MRAKIKPDLQLSLAFFFGHDCVVVSVVVKQLLSLLDRPDGSDNTVTPVNHNSFTVLRECENLLLSMLLTSSSA